MHVQRDIAVELQKLLGCIPLVAPAFTLVVICDEETPWGPCDPQERTLPITRPPSDGRVNSELTA